MVVIEMKIKLYNEAVMFVAETEEDFKILKAMSYHLDGALDIDYYRAAPRFSPKWVVLGHPDDWGDSEEGQEYYLD